MWLLMTDGINFGRSESPPRIGQLETALSANCSINVEDLSQFDDFLVNSTQPMSFKPELLSMKCLEIPIRNSNLNDRECQISTYRDSSNGIYHFWFLKCDVLRFQWTWCQHNCWTHNLELKIFSFSHRKKYSRIRISTL